MAKQTITAFLGKATTKRYAWAALAVVAAVVAVGCAARADDTSRGGSPATGRVAFVAQADRACRQFDAGLQSVAESIVGDRSLEELTPQELGAFSGGLLPVSDTYYRQVTALEAPPDGSDLAAQLEAYAYETFLLLSSLDVAGTLSPDAPFVASPADVQAHFTNRGDVEKEFREYGFASCGQLEL